MKERAPIICPELLNNQSHEPYRVELDRYWMLHPYKKKAIFEWFEQAQAMKGCQGKAYFTAFSHLWYAFNGWARCVTDTDVDAIYVNKLQRDLQLCQDFAKFTADSESPLALASTQFASFWPIFNVRSLRRTDMFIPHHTSREDAIKIYLRSSSISFAPKCAVRHKEEGQLLPIDWSHTLAALYQVRCNLFHGGKVLSSEEDQQILASAYKTLLFFLEQGDYLNDTRYC